MDRKEAEAAMEQAAAKTVGGAVLGMRGEEGNYHVTSCVVEARVTVRYPEEIDGLEWLSEDGDMRHAWAHMYNHADGTAADLEKEHEFLKGVKGSATVDEKVRAHLEKHLLMACHLAERLDELAEKMTDSSHECYADGVVKMMAEYLIPSVQEEQS